MQVWLRAGTRDVQCIIIWTGNVWSDQSVWELKRKMPEKCQSDDTPPNSRLQEYSVLNSSPSDCAKNLLSFMCQTKGQEKHKGQILNPLPSGSCLQPLQSVIQCHWYTPLQITLVLGGQSTLGTAFPSCWHPEPTQWQVSLSCIR